jgi:hypothetical protein
VKNEKDGRSGNSPAMLVSLRFVGPEEHEADVGIRDPRR